MKLSCQEPRGAFDLNRLRIEYGDELFCWISPIEAPFLLRAVALVPQALQEYKFTAKLGEEDSGYRKRWTRLSKIERLRPFVDAVKIWRRSCESPQNVKDNSITFWGRVQERYLLQPPTVNTASLQ